MAPKTTQVAKAKKAKQAALQGTKSHDKRKMRTQIVFRRPHTLRLTREPKYTRKALKNTPMLDAYTIVKNPLTTESAMALVENNRTIAFIVDRKANKNQIKSAVKKLYDIDAARINTLIRPDGKKKAFVKLSADQDALEMANKIGLI